MAAWPPAAVLDQIEALPRAEGAWRWTAREHWHVTLRFIGLADEDSVAAALSGIEPTAPAEVALGPQVERLGRNVVMLPATGLDHVAGAVIKATATIGPVDDRPFRGHLTLARRRGKGRSALVGASFSARFHLREVCLVRSESRSDGPVYETVAVQPLA